MKFSGRSATLDGIEADGDPPVLKEEVPARFNRDSEIRVDLRSGGFLRADFDLR